MSIGVIGLTSNAEYDVNSYSEKNLPLNSLDITLTIFVEDFLIFAININLLQ